MGFGGIIVIGLFILAILYIISKFNKLFPPDKERIYRKELRRRRKQDYKDYHRAMFEAQDEFNHMRRLRDIRPFDLTGDNSHAKKIKDYF
jgi:hypothetical protein